MYIARHKISGNTAILIISVGDGDITEIVKTYKTKHRNLSKIKNRNVFTIKYAEKNLDENDWLKVNKKVENTLQEMSERGLTKIHLFMKTSLPFSAMIGNSCANRAKVFIYQRDRNGDKEYKFIGDLMK